MSEREKPLVQRPWAGLPVLEGTRWAKIGAYSGFHIQYTANPLLFMLPITENGGFIIHQDENSRVVLQADSRSNAVLKITTGIPRNEYLVFWSGDSGVAADTIVEGVYFSEDRKELHVPKGTIVYIG